LIIEEEVVEPEPLEEPEEVVEEEPLPVPEVEEEPTPEELAEPTPEELAEEEVVEPEVEELLEEEEVEILEPPVEEEPIVVPEVEEPEFDEPVIEEPTVEELSLPEFDPEAQLSEAPEPVRERLELLEKPVKTPIARDAQVRRLRKAVKRQRSSAQMEMDKVRRQREAQIRRLRVTNGMIIPYGEQGKGLLSRVKGLFSKLRRRM